MSREISVAWQRHERHWTVQTTYRERDGRRTVVFRYDKPGGGWYVARVYALLEDAMKRWLLALALAVVLVGCGSAVGPEQAPSEHGNGVHG